MNVKSAPQPLTPKEKKVLEFIEGFINQKGFSPSYQEIRTHFQFASFNSVQRYLQQLERKNYLLVPGDNKKRALQVLKSSDAIAKAEALKVPLLGRVAAGRPIEEYEHNEFLDVPLSLIRRPETTFALTVKGSSMIDDGILDGDTILVQKARNAHNGDVVVASVEGEATVKRYYFQGSRVELRPANSSMTSMWFDAAAVRIEGVVVGLIRKM